MTDTVTIANFLPRLGSEPTVPIGPLYVTAVLERAGCTVDFRDYQITSHKRPLSAQNIIRFLSGSERTLGVSCQFNALPFVLNALGEIKERDPQKTIVLGGPGPSAVAEDIVRHFAFIDVIVRGEGEETMLELAEGKPLRDIRGIVYRDRGTVISTPPRKRIQDLDGLPFPAYHNIDFSKYAHAGIITARGCPFHCTFCEVAPLWGNNTVRRGVANVIAEMRFLHDRYGVRTFHIHDDTFVLDRRWVRDFCRSLRDEGLDVSWLCLGRINLVDEEMLSDMAAAGCRGVQYGIESGSDAVLKRIHKGLTVEQILDVAKTSLRHIDNVTATFMWGFPFESMDDFYETVYLMGVMAGMGCTIKLLSLAPAPLSPLYRKYSHQLRFSEEYVSNLLWGVLDSTTSKAEKDRVVKMIVRHPEIFSGFYHFHSKDLTEKHTVLKESNLLTVV